MKNHQTLHLRPVSMYFIRNIDYGFPKKYIFLYRFRALYKRKLLIWTNGKRGKDHV